MNNLGQILKEIQNEIGGDFVSTNVVGLDGMAIAELVASSDFDASAAAARFAMVMKLASKVAGKVDMGEVDDGLVTTDQVFILTRFLGDGSYYWGLIVSKDATLGVVRMLMHEYADRLWAAIPR